MLLTLGGVAFAVLLLLTPQAPPGPVIRVWKVGSPHTGDTPGAGMPPALAREAGGRGWRFSIEAFPAQSFASRFLTALSNGSAPDLLVFDNFGIMDGITTDRETFPGIGENPAVRKQLIQVTGSFEELLGPARGWTFLVTSSANHAAARQLALRAPRCGGAPSAQHVPADLAVSDVAAAYLAGDTAVILNHADSERLASVRADREPVTVGGVAVCGGWGNERLAFVTVNASYQGNTTIGHAALLLAFRKTSSLWRLLVVARDPVSNRQFAARLPVLSAMLSRDLPAGQVPRPATLVSPRNGAFPVPANSARFGDFAWQSSPDEDVVAEVAEFSYHDDARLFLLPAERSNRRRRVSAGELWTTRGDWAWRVWSITRSGEMSISDVRTFVH